MAVVILATRELKNKATGLDLAVPNYEDVPGAFGSSIGGSVLYHVIVVTRLFYFKTPGKHKESDVVQFMTPQKYHVFEELYHKLSQKFPSVIFPPLPKKVLLINDSVVNERRRFMETVLQQIARTPKLAGSSLVLEFLGARHGAADVNKLEDTKYSQSKGGSGGKEEEADEEVDLFAADVKGQREKEEEQEDEVEGEEEEDLLAMAKTVSAKARPAPPPKRSVFGLDDDEEDSKIDDLFIPAETLPKQQEKGTIQTEDNSELLRVDENLDEIFSKRKKPPKPAKPRKPDKPTATKPPLKPRLKPELKPKPAPKTTFQESGGGEDELFKVSERKPSTGVVSVPDKDKPRWSEDKDLFAAGRKQSGSFRKASHEEDTLDDIFKTGSSKSPFTAAEDDDDLFKSLGPSHVAEMNTDDISQYIQQNLADNTNENLDLF